jgi:hypothetical protein
MHTEYLIRHNGKSWVAENELCSLSASTLEELDLKVETHLRQTGLLKKGERMRVFMFFDNSTIPEWIRQYAQHYFNRVIEVKG